MLPCRIESVSEICGIEWFLSYAYLGWSALDDMTVTLVPPREETCRPREAAQRHAVKRVHFDDYHIPRSFPSEIDDAMWEASAQLQPQLLLEECRNIPMDLLFFVFELWKVEGMVILTESKEISLPHDAAELVSDGNGPTPLP